MKAFKVLISSTNGSQLVFIASEKQMKLVCRESSEEHLQPFKEKLEEFFQKGKDILKYVYIGQYCNVLQSVLYVI